MPSVRFCSSLKNDVGLFRIVEVNNNNEHQRNPIIETDQFEDPDDDIYESMNGKDQIGIMAPSNNCTRFDKEKGNDGTNDLKTKKSFSIQN